MKLLVKIGGAALEQESVLRNSARALKQLAHGGHQIVLVHGGGGALTRTLEKMGTRSEFVNGLRVTDAETRDVAVMVLAGLVNKQVVSALAQAGLTAFGMCGGDGMSVRARRKPANGCDLGYVGDIEQVETRWIEAIWALNAIPVISSIALGPNGEYYNVNADQMAAACAVACGADALIFLTDVPGVKDRSGSVIPTLRMKEVQPLVESAVIAGGMLPKLQACGRALEGGVARVRILPATQTDILPQCFSSTVECGTEVTTA